MHCSFGSSVLTVGCMACIEVLNDIDIVPYDSVTVTVQHILLENRPTVVCGVIVQLLGIKSPRFTSYLVVVFAQFKQRSQFAKFHAALVDWYYFLQD